MDETIYVLDAGNLLRGTFAFDSVFDPGYVYMKMSDINNTLISYAKSCTHREDSSFVRERLERLRSELYTDLDLDEEPPAQRQRVNPPGLGLHLIGLEITSNKHQMMMKTCLLHHP